jgi:hypothetical protein
MLRINKTVTLKFIQNNLETSNNTHKDSSNKTALLKALSIIIIIIFFCLAEILINYNSVFYNF